MKLIATNRKARYEYFIEDKFEAGLVLTSSEVKSIRGGKVTIDEAFIGMFNGELHLLNSHVAKYFHASIINHEENRRRKLLLHKRESDKITGKIKKGGYTAVPLQMYFNDKNKIKIEIAIAKGKHDRDKRQVVKEREWAREKRNLDY